MCEKAEGQLKAEQANLNKSYYGDTCTEAVYHPPTLREEAENRVGYHRSEADKQDRAVAFFRENPAFDEFIRLIRSGAIQI